MNIVFKYQPRWIDIKTATQIYPFGRDWFLALIDEGKINFVQHKKRGKIILDTRELDQYLESKKINVKNISKRIIDSIE